MHVSWHAYISACSLHAFAIWLSMYLLLVRWFTKRCIFGETRRYVQSACWIRVYWFTKIRIYFCYFIRPAQTKSENWPQTPQSIAEWNILLYEATNFFQRPNSKHNCDSTYIGKTKNEQYKQNLQYQTTNVIPVRPHTFIELSLEENNIN